MHDKVAIQKKNFIKTFHTRKKEKKAAKKTKRIKYMPFESRNSVSARRWEKIAGTPIDYKQKAVIVHIL